MFSYYSKILEAMNNAAEYSAVDRGAQQRSRESISTS